MPLRKSITANTTPDTKAVIKVHTSAIAVVPPVGVWQRIQAVRCFHDKSFVRWPPHVNLLYPFFPDDTRMEGNVAVGIGAEADNRSAGSAGGACRSTGDGAFRRFAARAGKALSLVAPFRVRLEQLRVFRHSARSLTVWAEPATVEAGGALGIDSSAGHVTGWQDGGTSGGANGSPATSTGGLIQVQRLLEAEFPGCDDLSSDPGRGIHGFVPHLSLGQLRREEELQALQAAWQPIEFLVDSVQLISRRGYLSPFTIRYHVPLGMDLDLDGGDAEQLPVFGSGKRQRIEPASPGAVQRRPGASAQLGRGSGKRRDIVRLDIPYMATMACMAGQACGGPLEGAGDSYVARLVRRFASPCQVLYALAPGGQTSDGAGRGSAGGQVGAGTASSRPADAMASDGASGTAAAAAETAAAPGGGRASAVLDLGTEPGIGQETGPAAEPDLWLGRGSRLDQLCDGDGDEVAGEEPAGAGGAGGGGDGYVWWFAYGAAVATEPQRIGAVQSVPARIEGYELVFNRRGGRANLAPVGTSPPGAGAGEGGIVTHGSANGSCGVPAVAEGCGGDGPDSDGQKGTAPAPCGVLHLLPVDRMARLLLATGGVSPVEVRCVPCGPVRSSPPSQCRDGDGAAAGFKSCGERMRPSTPACAAAGSDSGGTTTGSNHGAAAADDRTVMAVALLVPRQRCLTAGPVTPSEGYMASLRKAYEGYTDDIDCEFLDWLQAIGTAHDAAGRGAVYSIAADGHSRSGPVAVPFRTGAKKAAAGLPRCAVDW